LADNDARGYYRYSVAKQGSIILASESQRMAIPKAKFSCVSSADPEWYEFPHKTGLADGNQADAHEWTHV
jgi:DNA topoisomerase-6 subunit A